MDGWLEHTIVKEAHVRAVPLTRANRPQAISLARLRRILNRESACIVPEDVPGLMQVITREAAAE